MGTRSGSRSGARRIKRQATGNPLVGLAAVVILFGACVAVVTGQTGVQPSASATATPPRGGLGLIGPGSGTTVPGATGTTPISTLAPPPRSTPKPAAPTCRGAIPSGTAALEGPLRKPVGATTTAALWYVVDGDTIRLTNKDYVRLIGMDTPETVKPGTPVQPYGPQASADLKAMLAGHSTVVLERDVSNTDYYGRLLRFVWIRDGTTWFQLDYELVVRGDARLDTIGPDVRYASDYAAAQSTAQAHHVGRWATC
jgi:micrococcal nuclease